MPVTPSPSQSCIHLSGPLLLFTRLPSFLLSAHFYLFLFLFSFIQIIFFPQPFQKISLETKKGVQLIFCSAAMKKRFVRCKTQFKIERKWKTWIRFYIYFFYSLNLCQGITNYLETTNSIFQFQSPSCMSSSWMNMHHKKMVCDENNGGKMNHKTYRVNQQDLFVLFWKCYFQIYF